MKILTVTGYKGGIGKSTTALHIALFFSSIGSTLLVDGDPNRTAMSWSQRADNQLPFKVVDERSAMKVISGHDFVIIDTPARPDSADLKELGNGCDLLILPTTPDVVSLEPMLATAKDLNQAKCLAKYRAVVTIVPPRPNKEGDIVREELQAGGFPVFQSTIRRTVQFAKMAKVGLTIRDSNNDQAKAAWEDFESLGKEILEITRV
jgi:chromosome partitioning protein